MRACACVCVWVGSVPNVCRTDMVPYGRMDERGMRRVYLPNQKPSHEWDGTYKTIEYTHVQPCIQTKNDAIQIRPSHETFVLAWHDDDDDDDYDGGGVDRDPSICFCILASLCLFLFTNDKTQHEKTFENHYLVVCRFF